MPACNIKPTPCMSNLPLYLYHYGPPMSSSLPKLDNRIVVDSTSLPSRKFGKQIQKRQLEIPEYAASFVDYKALKKVIVIGPFI